MLSRAPPRKGVISALQAAVWHFAQHSQGAESWCAKWKIHLKSGHEQKWPEIGWQNGKIGWRPKNKIEAARKKRKAVHPQLFWRLYSCRLDADREMALKMATKPRAGRSNGLSAR